MLSVEWVGWVGFCFVCMYLSDLMDVMINIVLNSSILPLNNCVLHGSARRQAFYGCIVFTLSPGMRVKTF